MFLTVVCRNVKKLFFTAIFASLCFQLIAQKTDSGPIKLPECPTGDATDIQFQYSGRCDGGNFRNYDDLFVLRLFLEVPIYNFTFEDTSPDKSSTAVAGKDIDFEPNVSSNIGLGLSYKGYGISGSLPLPNTNKDTRIYGDTNYFDFQFYFVSRHWGADFFYQNYSGFYLKEPGNFDASFTEGQVHPQYNDLRIFNIGVGGFYNFNEKYSANAAFSQGERQLTSAGSFVLDSSVSFTRISNNENIVPASQISLYPDLADYRGGEYVLWVLRPGYGYNFVYRRMTVGGIFSLGPNLQHQLNRTVSGSNRRTRMEISARIRFSAWFEFQDHFFGGMLLVDVNRIAIQEFALESRTSTIQFFYGTMFDGW